MRGLLGALLLGSLAWLVPTSAAAQALTPRDFEIDVHTGPVLGSSRMIGLGGAYSAIATGISGVAWNPASYASREPWELDSTTWDLTLGLLASYSGSDHDNNGDRSADYDAFTYVDAGLGLQLGAAGLGLLARAFNYALKLDGRDISVGALTASYGLGYGFLDGQLVLGGGARTAGFSVMEGAETLLDLSGTAPEVGALVRLAGQRWRAGAAFRAGVTVDDPRVAGVTSTALALPRAAHLPWELQLGFAFQLGGRPFNRRFVSPARAEERLEAYYLARRRRRASDELRREQVAAGALTPLDAFPTDPAWLAAEDLRQLEDEASLEQDLEYAEVQRAAELRSLPRDYVLLASEIVVTGPTSDGVGVEGFLRGVHDRSGERVSVSARLGVELEPWIERLKVRCGSYYEPSRFAAGSGRVHATAGFDLHVFDWNVFGLVDETGWRISAVADVSARYFDWGVGLGVWH
jgi:hypothetical protein